MTLLKWKIKLHKKATKSLTQFRLTLKSYDNKVIQLKI